ncbi:PP2C family protein-serine/threonine phosphatase [Catellatospora methionotrophica]|uniref:PP2C family protein-serine/threonine phosphatase n=1 Tax=Catellatospora methionotrophica TaxID=121620 RepID=UPI0033E10724
MLEDSADDLYEHAPCGNLSTMLDGTIAKINETLLGWLGYDRAEIVARRRFSDLLTVGGKIYYETHYAPLLTMQGEIGGVALDLRAKDGRKLPVLVTSTVKTGADGQPLLIRTTLFDARDRRAYETELLRARHAAEASEQAAQQDRQRLQKLVAGLQRSLLPRTLATPPSMDVAAYYHMASADEVGGDFYDLFPLGGDRWGFFLGDVCGKGVEAAAVTSLARYTLRAATVYDPDPAAVLGNLNTVLYQEYQSDSHRHCTVVFGILGPATSAGRTMTVTGGGHPPALLLTAAGTAEYLDTSGGPLVGLLPDLRFTTHTYTLRPGDTLILYTDGLIEARTDADRGRYSSEDLLDFATSLAPASAGAAVAALTDLLTRFGTGLDDDAAVMALTALPPPPAGGEPVHRT